MNYPQTFIDWLEDNAKVKKTAEYIYNWERSLLVPEVEYLIIAKIKFELPDVWFRSIAICRYTPEKDHCYLTNPMNGLPEERVQEAKAFILSKVIKGEV